MVNQLNSALTILRRKPVAQETGLPCSMIYACIKLGTFPSPI